MKEKKNECFFYINLNYIIPKKKKRMKKGENEES